MRGKIFGIAIALMLALTVFSLPVRAQATTVSVDPSLTSAMPGDVVVINLAIADAVGVYAWGLRMSWTPNLFTVLDVSEGSFLAGQAPFGTFFVWVKNEAEGYVDLGATMIGVASGASGSDIMATLTLMVNDYGNSGIDLSLSKLLDPVLGTISHSLVGGSYVSTQYWNVNLEEKRTDSRYWSIAMLGDTMTFYGKGKSEVFNPVSLMCKIVFTGTNPDSTPFYLETGVVTIDPGKSGPFQTAVFGPLTVPDSVGSYHLKASALFSLNGLVWTEGAKTKSFTQVVAP